MVSVIVTITSLLLEYYLRSVVQDFIMRHMDKIPMLKSCELNERATFAIKREQKQKLRSFKDRGVDVGELYRMALDEVIERVDRILSSDSQTA